MSWMVLTAAVAGLIAGWLAPWLTQRLPEPDAADKVSYQDLALEPRFRWGALAVGPISAVVLALTLPGWWELSLWLVALSPLLALAYLDARTRLLPTRLVIPTTLVVVVLAVATGWAEHREDLIRGLLALLVARSLFWLLWFLKPAGFGFGDVRLVALLGFLLGVVGWNQWLTGLYAGIAVFAVVGVLRALWRRDKAVLKVPWPFGPALILGAWCGPIIGRLVAS